MKHIKSNSQYFKSSHNLKKEYRHKHEQFRNARPDTLKIYWKRKTEEKEPELINF